MFFGEILRTVARNSDRSRPGPLELPVTGCPAAYLLKPMVGEPTYKCPTVYLVCHADHSNDVSGRGHHGRTWPNTEAR